MSQELLDIVRSRKSIPLSWVTTTPDQNYLNLGDALSPVIVSMMSGLPVDHTASKSELTRLAAVGTIGHMFAGGDVSFWGTGTSPNLNPNQSEHAKIPYTRPANTKFHTYATRGPFSRRILSPDATGPAVYGDPLWLLPRFHEAPKKKTYELGVILHLSELADREYDAHAKADSKRHEIADADRQAIKLINTVTPVSIAALRERLDEILACKRIVSTSLHGMVFAESYGIPCLYFSPRAKTSGLGRIDLLAEEGLDLRFVDLYRGLGQDHLDVWYQPRAEETNWDNLIRTIDDVWEQKYLAEEPLIESFPLPLSMMGKGTTGSAFDHPLIGAVPTKRETSVIKRAKNSFLSRILGRAR